MLERFHRKLGEQLRFIGRSSKTYDQGMEEEALRIAVSIRIIFHDTKHSVSLLNHLDMEGGNILSSTRGLGDWQDYLSQKIDLASTTPVRMIPVLGNNFRQITIKDWWDGETAFSCLGTKFTRKKIILSVANKDGGAHVDKELERYYEILCSGEYAFGVTGKNLKYDGKEPFEQGVKHYPKNAHLALIRQFSHEVLLSSKHYSWPVA